MQSFKIRNNIVYFDETKRTIARIPTSSNLKKTGSDNSLYFGTTANETTKDILRKIVGTKNFNDINGLNLEMFGYGAPVDVTLNINNQGQIQIKINHNGMMRKLFDKFQLTIKEIIPEDQVLIVIDFRNLEIRFKKLSDLDL